MYEPCGKKVPDFTPVIDYHLNFAIFIVNKAKTFVRNSAFLLLQDTIQNISQELRPGPKSNIAMSSNFSSCRVSIHKTPKLNYLNILFDANEYVAKS